MQRPGEDREKTELLIRFAPREDLNTYLDIRESHPGRDDAAALAAASPQEQAAYERFRQLAALSVPELRARFDATGGGAV
jgi:hypothetical protein